MNNNSPQTTDPAIHLPANDPGYYYDPRVEAGQHGEIKLSPPVAQRCKTCPSAGQPPYQILDPTSGEPTWCVCYPYRRKIQEINKLIKSSDIPERFRYKFREAFHNTYDDQPIAGAREIKSLLDTLINATKMANNTKGLFLWGTPGNGKTLLSCIALNELIFHTARAGKFIGLSRKFFQTLRHTFDEDSPIYGQSGQIIDTLSSIPYLVIDDFGVQRNTEWELEMLYNLIDARYAEQRLTIVTTNQNINDIKDLAHGRIYSRLLEMCHILHITAPDYREHFKREHEV